MKRFNLALGLSKTVYFTPQPVFNRSFATVPAGCYSAVFFFYLFIFAESLKNHNKSQKNHKLENSILLDSTRVDLHSEYIIRYALVHFF